MLGKRASSVFLGRLLQHSRKSVAGVLERLALLEPHFPDIIGRIREMEIGEASGDAIDAYALLWTARRWRDGLARTIPEEPVTDGRGLRMEMVC